MAVGPKTYLFDFSDESNLRKKLRELGGTPLRNQHVKGNYKMVNEELEQLIDDNPEAAGFQPQYELLFAASGAKKGGKIKRMQEGGSTASGYSVESRAAPILKPYSSVTIILSETKKMETHGTKS